MNNQVTIQRRKVENMATGYKWLEAHIFDDYGALDSVPLIYLPANDIELFTALVKAQINDCSTGVDTILRYLFENESGIAIDGAYYFYDQIEPILKSYMENCDE